MTIKFSDYRQDALEQHNRLRAIHDSPPMTLNSSLNRDADRYARRLFDMLRCRGRLKHSNAPGVGENLASGWTTAIGAGVEGRSVEDGVKAWYVKQYRPCFIWHFIMVSSKMHSARLSVQY